ncbi:Atp5jp [Mactra antiquata]
MIVQVSSFPVGQVKVKLIKMLTQICLNHLRTAGRCLQQQARRNFGVTAVAFQQAEDPIQQLFVDKIREYAQKKKAAGGQFVDATPESMKDYDKEIKKIKTQYQAEGKDFSKFPEYSYSDIAAQVTESTESRSDTDLPFVMLQTQSSDVSQHWMTSIQTHEGIQL